MHDICFSTKATVDGSEGNDPNNTQDDNNSSLSHSQHTSQYKSRNGVYIDIRACYCGSYEETRE